MAVEVRSAPGLSAGIPQKLFDDVFNVKGATHTGWDVAPDGRFLMERPDSTAQAPCIQVIEHAADEIARRLAPAN
ncbi:MAG: hypothetical protein HY657_15215 [Acidobacteria bacterium]|nr:hypothetical protein [Acidobacteriota bacterium]